MTMVDRPHYVILSVDAYAETSDGDHCLQAPKHGEWTLTEGDEQYECDWYAEEFGDPSYLHGKHRKWTGILSEAEFDAWLQDECYADRQDARDSAERTMGSITEFGHLPAYALNDEPMDWNIGGVTQVINRQAYVTEYALGDPPADVLPALLAAYGMEE